MFRICFALILCSLIFAGCSTSSGGKSVASEETVLTVKGLAQLPVVSSEVIGKYQFEQHAFVEKNRAAITFKPVLRSEAKEVQELAFSKVSEICAQFGPPLSRTNFAVGQVAAILGSGKENRPAYDGDAQKAFYVIQCSVIRAGS